MAIVRDHAVADGVVPLHIWDRAAVNQEVFANHLDVWEPITPVFDILVIGRIHNKSGCNTIQIVSALDRSVDILHVLLILEPAHDHGFDELPRSLTVSMHTIRALRLYESISSIVELGDISAKILDQSELSTRMLSFITIRV